MLCVAGQGARSLENEGGQEAGQPAAPPGAEGAEADGKEENAGARQQTLLGRKDDKVRKSMEDPCKSVPVGSF